MENFVLFFISKFKYVYTKIYVYFHGTKMKRVFFINSCVCVCICLSHLGNVNSIVF